MKNQLLYFKTLLIVVILGSFFSGSVNAQSFDEIFKAVASDGAADQFFGQSVSISGDKAIVGAWGDDDNGSYSGSAYVFSFDGSSGNSGSEVNSE